MQESQFLKEKSESKNEIEIVAIVDNVVVGTAMTKISWMNNWIFTGIKFTYGIFILQYHVFYLLNSDLYV